MDCRTGSAPRRVPGGPGDRWWYGLFSPAIQPGPKAAVLGDAPELTSFRVAIRPESRPSSKRSAWHPHALGPCRRGAGLRRKLHDYLSFTIEKAQNPAGLSHVSQDVREKGDLRLCSKNSHRPVSYTHLTLPTIYSV